MAVTRTVRWAKTIDVVAVATVMLAAGSLPRADGPSSDAEFETTSVIKNDLVTVKRHSYPAGATSAMHTHANRVNVFLTDLDVHVTTVEGEQFEATRQKGTAVWSEATSHALRALSDFEVVVVELRQEYGETLPISSEDATRVVAQHYELEFENEWVRIVKVKLPAGTRTPSFVHSLPAVTVVLDGSRIRSVDDEGQTRDGDRQAGEVRWVDPIGRHSVENVGKTGLIAIRVEIKRAPA